MTSNYSPVLVAGVAVSKGITVAEVMELGESVTPAPGLLKKREKDEKSPRLVAPTLILSLTITEFYPLLNNKQRARRCTHTLGSRALRLTYL